MANPESSPRRGRPSTIGVALGVEEPQRLACWLGLNWLALGSGLLLFPYLPARDPSGLRPNYPHIWPLAITVLAASVVLLAWGRLRAR